MFYKCKTEHIRLSKTAQLLDLGVYQRALRLDVTKSGSSFDLMFFPWSYAAGCCLIELRHALVEKTVAISTVLH